MCSTVVRPSWVTRTVVASRARLPAGSRRAGTCSRRRARSRCPHTPRPRRYPRPRGSRSRSGAAPLRRPRAARRHGAQRLSSLPAVLYFRACRHRRHPFGGGIAQLGERLAGSQKVTGSSPVTSTNFLAPPALAPSTPPTPLQTSPPPRFLLPLVFLAGIGSMATEICASRLLAPYYGSSTVVWANIIGLILASLSVGYWLGGKLADRRPSPRLLAGLVLAAAVLVAAIPFVARPFLDLSVRAIDTLSTGAVVGSFAASLVLFAPAGDPAGHGHALRHSPCDDRRRRRRQGGRPRLRPLHRRQPHRHVRAGAHHDPAHRHAAHDARRGGRAGAGRRAAAGPPLGRRRGRPARACSPSRPAS